MTNPVTNRLKAIKPIDIIFLTIAFIVPVIFSLIYVSAERYFYYWDYSGFQSMAARIARDFIESPALMLNVVRNSINYEYNFYYTIPLIPFLVKFNTSRLAYIGGLIVIYQVPYALVLGSIATRVIYAPRRAVFWSTVLLAFLTPMTLAPTLRGYPDVAAALIISLAVWVYLVDVRLTMWWQPALIGLFLAVAILLRRHFIYDAAIIIVAMALIQLFLYLWNGKEDRPVALRNMLMAGVKIGLILAILLLVFLVFGRPFLSRLLQSDYRALYQSYANPPVSVLKMFISYYGWISLALATSGFLLGLSKGVLNRISSSFLIIIGLLSWFTWVVFIRYYATHYTLHLTYILVFGISGLFWTAWQKTHDLKRWLWLTILSILVVVNAIIHLAPTGSTPILANLFPMRYPPLVRQDYDEVGKLVSFLRKKTLPGESIFVVDSSSLMNDDLLRNAELSLYGGSRLNIVRSPQVDSRDYYPLEQLMEAEYILVSEPYQYILRNPDEQKVSGVVYDALQEGWEFSQDFRRLPRKFQLSNGVVLNIYQRIRPTSIETALRTFDQMLAYIGRRPGQQPEWIILARPDKLQWSTTGDASYHLEFDANNRDTISPAISWLKAEKIAGGFKVLLNISSLRENCPSARLVLQATDSSGNPTQLTEVDLSKASQEDRAVVQFDDLGSQTLLFTIDIPEGESCSAALDWKIQKPSP